MGIAAKLVSDSEIIQAALEKFRCVDAEVVVQKLPERATNFEESGTWFVLGVKQHPGSAWECIGRRRTRGELLELAKRGSVDYRTCPRSS